VIRWVS